MRTISALAAYLFLKLMLLFTGKKVRKGYAYNPLRKFPRNVECWCGSKIKSKKCCLPKIKPIIPKNLATTLKQYMNFVKENTT